MFRVVVGSWGLLERKQRYWLASLTLFAMFLNFLDVVGIVLVGVLAAGATTQESASGNFGLGNWLETMPWNLLLLLVILLFLAKAGLTLLVSRSTLLYLAKIEAELSMRLAEGIFLRDLGHMKSLSRPEIEWAILRSTNVAFRTILGEAGVAIVNFSLSLLVFFLLLWTDWKTALAVTVYVAVTLTLFHLSSEKLAVLQGKEFATGSVLVNQSLSNLISSFREIAVLAKREFFMTELAKARKRVAEAGAITSFLGVLPRQIVELTLVVGLVGYLAFLGGQPGSADLTVFAVFLVGGFRMISALLPLQRAIMLVRSEAPSAELAQLELRKFLDQKRAASEVVLSSAEEQEPTCQQLESGLEVRVLNVRFGHSDGDPRNPSIRGVSLSVSPGGTAAIIGPSGGGKSTLLEIILGLHSPDSGEALLSGFPARDFSRRFPGAIGFVPQSPGIIAGTIEENIALGVLASEIDNSRIAEVLRISNLLEVVESIPGGVKSNIGKHVDKLSGGQLQRLGLARALYTRPKLLVLDEYTSALDADTEASISQSLRALRGTMTTVIVAHRLSTIKEADLIYVFENGRIVESGSFRHLRQSSEMVKRYISLMSLDT